MCFLFLFLAGKFASNAKIQRGEGHVSKKGCRRGYQLLRRAEVPAAVRQQSRPAQKGKSRFILDRA